MIMINIEMPEKCGECPCFHAEYPLHCQLIKPPDKNKQLSAPYDLPRPDWCPLLQEAIPVQEAIPADTKVIGMLNGTDIEVFCCPDCRMILDDSFHFCPNCGQAVKFDDWGSQQEDTKMQ